MWTEEIVAEDVGKAGAASHRILKIMLRNLDLILKKKFADTEVF